MAYEKERDVAIQAALEAGRLIRMHAGRLDGEAVREKAVNDLVTEVDEQAQHLIVDILKQAFPDYKVLAEEDAAAHAQAEAPSRRRWIIDPIDGTVNFTHDYAPYAVSIALQDGDEIIVGVVLDVPRQELFTAVLGGGLRVNGVPARVSQTDALSEALVGTGFPFRVFEHVDAYLEVLRELMGTTRGVRRAGAAAIDLAHVACGRFDGFFEAGLHPWDVAAGMLLVEEAGGRVSDYCDRPQPLFAEQVVATNGRVHKALLEAVAPLRAL